MYVFRAIGGSLYLLGMILCAYNLIKTMRQGKIIFNEKAEAPPLDNDEPKPGKGLYRHRILERKPVLFTIIAFIVVSIGAIVEIVPNFVIKSNVPTIASVKPYTPLELEGRDVYIEEGCYYCHSQMIRPFRFETARYGDYSKAGEFVYDHPFQWGSKRTGPDLHRVGKKYPDAWHYNHMHDPTSMSPGSIMPPFPWLARDKIDFKTIRPKIRAMQKLGVPYPEGYDIDAPEEMQKQANEIVKSLADAGITVKPDKKIVALIAYLQRLGVDIKVETNQGN
jgi:cytochrome c oxidase cbb3-type subunit I/II